MALCPQPTALNVRPQSAAKTILFIEFSLQILVTAVDPSPFTERQTVQRRRPDGSPYQTQRRITDGCCHSPDLAILAFTDTDFQPRSRDRRAKADRRIARPQPGRFVDQPDPGRPRGEIREFDANAQP